MTVFADLVAAAQRGSLTSIPPDAMSGLSGPQQLQLSQAMVESAARRQQPDAPRSPTETGQQDATQQRWLQQVRHDDAQQRWLQQMRQQESTGGPARANDQPIPPELQRGAPGEPAYPSLRMIPELVNGQQTDTGTPVKKYLGPPPNPSATAPAGPGLSYGTATPGDPDRAAERLWEQDRGVAPSGQPRRNTATPEAPSLSVDTPPAAPAVPERVGVGLAMPSSATRTTGSSARPDASGTVARANEMNFVQRKAAEWFGIDTPEERMRAKTYLANWAVGMAHSTAGIGAFADANLAGVTGVNEEELRQLGIDMKKEEADMRREDAAYRRTRDAINDQRADRRDARDAMMDGYRIDEYQRAAAEDRERRAMAQSSPFYGTGLAGGNLEQQLQLADMIRRQNPDWTEEQVAQRVQELWMIQNPPKAPTGLDALLGGMQ